MDQKLGQSLIELVVGMAIGVIFIIGIGTVIAPSLQIGHQTTQVELKSQLAASLADNIRAWSGNWNNVLALATGTAHVYSLNTNSSPFTASAGVQQISLGSTTYNAQFYLTDAYRSVSGYATTTVGSSYDPSTKFFTLTISATTTPASPSLSISFYLTRNADNVFTQTSWAGGSGQNGPLTVAGTGFSSDSNILVSATGSLSLATTSVDGTLDSPTFDTGVASGSALNSVFWQGSTPSNSAVEFQIAPSNSQSGPWNFEGPDGTINTYFTGSSGATTPLLGTSAGYSLFSGYRYFRYRTTLFPDSSLTMTPVVSWVTIHWSP